MYNDQKNPFKSPAQNRFNLRRHRIGVHGGTESEYSTREYPCEICSKVFHYNDNLKRHRKNVHGLTTIIETASTGSGGGGGGASSSSSSMAMMTTNSSSNIKREITDDGQTMAMATYASSGAQTDEAPSSIGALTIATYAPENVAAGNAMALVETKPNLAAIHSQGTKAFVCEICHKNLQSNYNLKRHQVICRRLAILLMIVGHC